MIDLYNFFISRWSKPMSRHARVIPRHCNYHGQGIFTADDGKAVSPRAIVHEIQGYGDVLIHVPSPRRGEG